ncbi:MAG: hypothetical protein ACLR8Y_06685 [Alistipes indistinctus]
MIFILGYFILLELLDRTLRDRVRTERITGGRVLGAFPAPGKFRFRSYTKACGQVASQYLGNAALNYFKPDRPNVINLLSTDTGTGKSFLGEQLKGYFEEIGLNVGWSPIVRISPSSGKTTCSHGSQRLHPCLGPEAGRRT